MRSPDTDRRAHASDPNKLFVTVTWIADQVGCSISGAYVLAKDIGIVRFGAKRRLVRVRREDFDRYIEQRREVVPEG
jgi:hypothetical protein